MPAGAFSTVAMSDPRLLSSGRLLHGLYDVLVAGAAAQVALEPVPDLVLRRVRIALEQVRGSHDHAGCAEAALQGVLLVERLLHRVQPPGAKALDRQHGRAV